MLLTALSIDGYDLVINLVRIQVSHSFEPCCSTEVTVQTATHLRGYTGCSSGFCRNQNRLHNQFIKQPNRIRYGSVFAFLHLVKFDIVDNKISIEDRKST